MTVSVPFRRVWKSAGIVAITTVGLLVGPLTGTAFAAPLTFDVNTAGNASDTFIDGNCDTSAAAGLQCTLRGAIQEANGNAGADTITFSLASPFRVTLTASALPAITSPVLINGTSLPGYNPSGATIVRVDGASNTTGVQFGFDVQPGGDGTTIKGLEIDRMASAGIRLSSNSNVVAGNYIGSTAANALNCASGVSCSDQVGVLITDGSGNTIGGTTPADRNVISNNSAYGVQITTSAGSAGGNVVKGNYIGTNAAGSATLANGYGIVINNGGGTDPTGTVIGGTASGAGNVISGNSNNGVDISAGDTTILGNIVGLNATGAAAVPNNGTAGIYAYGATTKLVVGGPTAASRNVVSGNGQEGVELSGPTLPSTVQGNYVGTDITGTSAVGNGYGGLYVYNSDGFTLDHNVIAGNSVLTNGDQARFDYGIDAVIAANTIGLAANGSSPLGTSSVGLSLYATTNATIDANTISNGSSYGLYADQTDGVVVTNNKIGTDSGGTLDRGNYIGVYFSSASETQFGKPGAGNLISGNDAYGVEFAYSDHGAIQGNLIGTDQSGTVALDNGLTGIYLIGTARMAVGGSAPGARNVIVASGLGCCEAGIYLGDGDDNTILGNRIGVGSTGGSLPNNWAGVYLDANSNDNQVGGTGAGEGNIIANNADAAVIVNGRSNQIRGNSITANGALGIDLNQDGVTLNDPGDPDLGGNRLQNYPVLSTSASNANGTQVSGSLNSRPNRQYALDFYANTACDASGNGEGATYLGSTTVTTNGAGNVTFQASMATSAPAGSSVTATATDIVLGDTSEFSACTANQGGLPAASVANVSASEGAANLVFTVTLSSAPLFSPVTVAYQSSDGTATAPADYTAVSGTVTFTGSQTTQTVSVPINNDTLDEPDETMTLTLSNPTNALIMPGQGSATGTIQDNDAPPAISIVTAPPVTEPDTGTVNQTFTVTLSAASSLPITVIIHTVPGTASEGVDYVANAAQLSFNPGQTSKTFVVAVIGDTLYEGTENYSAQLLSPTNATIGTGTRLASIVNNDPPPNLTINDVSATEGNSSTTSFVFTLSLSAPSGKLVHAVVGTANGTAVAPGDYAPRNGASVNIAVGNTSATFTVKVKGDVVPESNETFFVNIDPINTTNATITDGQGQGTILNDD